METVINDKKWRIVQRPDYPEYWTIEQKAWFGVWQYRGNCRGSPTEAMEILKRYASPTTYYMD